MIQFGSVDAALAYANGHRLSVDTDTKSLGKVKGGQEYPLQFRLANHSDKQINIIMYITSCSCVSIDGLPMMILPRSERTLMVRVLAAANPGSINEKVYLYTDYNGQTEVALKITGVVTTSSAR
jgi:hypothetical protein